MQSVLGLIVFCSFNNFWGVMWRRVVVVVVSGAGQEQSSQAFVREDANNQQNQSRSWQHISLTHNSSVEM